MCADGLTPTKRKVYGTMPVLTTHAEIVARMRAIEGELDRLRKKEEKSDEDREAVPTLLQEFRDLNVRRQDMEHDAAIAEIREAAAGLNGGKAVRGAPDPENEEDADAPSQPAQVARTAVLERPASASTGRRRFRNPWDLSSVRTFGREPEAVAHELRERALDAIERMPVPHPQATAIREVCTRWIEEEEDENTPLARQILATSQTSYLRGFTKYMKASGQLGVLDPDEHRALTRAMSLTDAAGGYLIPFQLDPAVIITAAGSRNPIRRIARVVRATGDVWNGISSAGVTGSWDAEAAEVSDDAPTLAQPSITVYKGAVFVPISLEAFQDESNVAAEVSRMVAFETDRMESVGFVTGSGSGQPTGIVTALTGGSSEIASLTTDTFAVGDVYNLDGSLPERHAAGASYVAHRKIFNLVRQFDTSGGSSLWAQLGQGQPPELLGQPAYRAEAMDSTVTAAGENYLMVYGDFSNYVVADRIGTTIEFIPHLFGANRRPTGQRGWYAHFRVGADSVNDDAFRMLNVT